MLFLFTVVTNLCSQSSKLSFKIVNSENEPIEYASVVYQESDNKVLKAIVSDTLGFFSINVGLSSDIQLIIHHLTYKQDTVKIERSKIASWDKPYVITLKERENVLTDIIVKAEQPKMRISDNKLIYNAELIVRNRVTQNAYEIVKATPLVSEINNVLSLTGSETLDIVIDGKNTTMSLAQISNLLKSIPASDVKEVEVIYNPSARYRAKGSLINVILKDNKTDAFPITGEATVDYSHAYYGIGNPRINLSYNKNKLRLDLMADVTFGKERFKSKAYTEYELMNSISTIDEWTNSYNRNTSLSSMIGGSYAFSKKSQLRFSYYLKTNNSNSKRFTDNIYSENNYSYEVNSTNRYKDKTQLHYAYIEYAVNDVLVGADYTFFRNPTDNHYIGKRESEEEENFNNNSLQSINQWSVFVNQKLKFSPKITFTYGANGGLNNSDTKVEYVYHKPDTKTSVQIDTQDEYLANVFAEINYKITDKLSAFASLKAEYFESDYIREGVKTTLWSDWDFFPKLTLSYTPNTKNILQTNFSTGKRLPSFWAINPQVTSINSHAEIHGNPYLKPHKTYRGQVSYNRNKKYTINLSVYYAPDYFQQIPHMSEDQLKTIYRYENYDYLLRTGLTFIIPIDIGKVFSTQITLTGQRIQEKKDDFFGSSFDNVDYNGFVMINNSFKITESLLFELTGFYQSKSKQGTYDLGDIWSLGSRLRFSFAKSGQVVLKFDNILKNQSPRPITINHGNQYSWSRNYEYNIFGVSFTWSFNNFKSKRYKKADESRLSK